ncbi:hypothetical protein [Empedobacter sp.]|uniref:hypothetical protein n=1 Tax=Empedobacter sp. TaxID=1927715 RepID=UPI0028B1543C|nr:hypothetical protein [Empedobacter sp.]
MKLNWKSNLFLFVSILTYLVSLILLVHLLNFNFVEYYSGESKAEYLGIAYLILGYITISELPIDFICWLGNFTLLFSWIFYKKKVGLILSIIAIIQISLYGVNHLTRLDILQIHEYDLPLFGYWIWLFSSIFVLIYHYKKYKLKSQTL